MTLTMLSATIEAVQFSASFVVLLFDAGDKTNDVNNAFSHYRGSTVQCFLCCVTV